MVLTRLNPQISNSNLVQNPTLRYWQRDTSFTAGHSYVNYFNGYTADRWLVQPMAGTTTVTRPFLTTSDPMFAETYNSRHYLKWEGSSGTGDFDLLAQAIFDGLDASSVFTDATWFTLSFWAKTDTGNPTMWFALRRYFNEDDWTDGGVDIAHKASFQLTTSWQKFTFTFKTNAQTGSPVAVFYKNFRLEFFKRLEGSLATSYSVSPFDSSAFDLDITNIKLELGQEATPLVYDQQFDLVNCLRYFQKSWPLSVPIGTTNNGGHFWAAVNGNNSAIGPAGQIWLAPPRTEFTDRDLGGVPADSRIRCWAYDSTTIDQVWAQVDGLSRPVTNYVVRPSVKYVTITGSPTSDWFQANWAADFEFWF